jgi:hypothetical protein
MAAWALKSTDPAAFKAIAAARLAAETDPDVRAEFGL